MYTLYRSSVAFYECLITIVIALLCTAATQKKILYYPLHIDITSSNTRQMKIKAVSQWTARFNIEKKPKNVGVYLEISLLDCLTTKIPGFFQDYSYSFPGLYNSLPIECFPLTYDLSGFKSRINRHILTVGSF